MILHDPKLEEVMIGLAAKSRDGKLMQRGDSRVTMRRVLFSVLKFLLLGIGVIVVLGQELDRHWLYFGCVLVLMVQSVLGTSALSNTMVQSGFHSVLINLPISGSHALRWIRGKFLRSNWIKFLIYSALMAGVSQSGNFVEWFQLAGRTVLICAVLLATIRLFDASWVRRMRIVSVWIILFVVSVLGIIYLLNAHGDVFKAGQTPAWLVTTIKAITWIYPFSWVLPGYLENGGAILALVWVVMGLRQWINWPDVAGREFERAADFVGAHGDFAFGEEWDEEDLEMQEDFIEDGQELAALPSGKVGWVDRWIQKRLSSRERSHFEAFCDYGKIYTPRAKQVFVYLPAWLVFVWLFHEYAPTSWARKGAAVFWGLTSVYLIFLLRLSNAIPRANSGWQMGAQNVPFFTLLPVSCRDLLRLSQRITIPPSCVALLIAVPVLNSMCRIFDTSTHLAFFLAPSILGLWIVSRPLLVWYRLQEVARNKGGVAQMIYFAAMLVTVVLGVLWLIACSVTIFFSLGVDSLKEALVVLPLSILSAGVFARLIFEIFVWRVRRNHIDWMRTF